MIRTLSVLLSAGDLKITWNSDSPEEVAKARAEVEILKQQGYSFFVADGGPADEVAAGNGELTFRRVDDPVAQMSPPEPAPAGKTRRGRPPTAAVAIPRMRGG